MKYLRFARRLGMAGLLASSAANACTADVESIGAEFAGKDLILSFRVVPDTTTATTVNFSVTVRYMSDGEPQAQTFSYEKQTTGAIVASFPAHADFDITEIGAVRIDSVACTP